MFISLHWSRVGIELSGGNAELVKDREDDALYEARQPVANFLMFHKII